MARPEKPESEKRSKQIVVYVHDNVKTALQKEADLKGVSVSMLASEIIEQHISNAKNEDQRIVVHPDVVYAVLKRLQHEGFEIRDKLAPDSKSQSDGDSADSTYPQRSVHNPVDTVGDKSGANISPKTSPPSPTGAKAGEQRGDEGGPNVASKTKRRAVDRGKGGEGT